MIATLLLLALALLCIVPATHSLPVLSISTTFLNSTCTTSATSANTSTNSTTCSSCPIAIVLTYPTPTASTNINCSLIPGYPDGSLYYSYLSSSYTAGNLTLYRTTNASLNCSAASYLTSFPIATVVQCSNSSFITQTFNFTTAGNFSSSMFVSNTSITNASSPFPYASTGSSCSNCSSVLSCPVANSTNVTMSSSYTLVTNVTVSSFCPTGCNSAYNAWIDYSSQQCFALAGSNPSLVCGCYAGSYIGKRLSSCFVSDASSQYLLSVQQATYANCSSYFAGGTRSSSTGMAYTAGSSAMASSTGTLPAATTVINQGAIVGGVIGGVVGIIVLILILRCCMRLQAKGHNIEIHRRGKSQATLEKELEEEGARLQAERDGGAAASATAEEADDEDDGDDMLGDDEGEDEEDGEEEEDVEQPRTAVQPARTGSTATLLQGQGGQGAAVGTATAR